LTGSVTTQLINNISFYGNRTFLLSKRRTSKEEEEEKGERDSRMQKETLAI
jgi:hypothetical protein